MNAQILNGIAQGNEALKALSDELNVERVEQIMGEAAEMQEWQAVSRGCSEGVDAWALVPVSPPRLLFVSNEWHGAR